MSQNLPHNQMKGKRHKAQLVARGISIKGDGYVEVINLAAKTILVQVGIYLAPCHG